MVNYPIDLRWWLLNNLVRVDNPNKFYKFFLIIFFLCFMFLALFPILVGRKNKNNRQFLLSDITFIFSLFSFVLAARWPAFLAPMLNPDEAQFIAGAIKLLKYPIFWRAVDEGSSGPLNIYPLTIPALFGLRVEYASVRIIGLLLVILSIICLYYSLKCIYGKTISRLSTIPVAVTFAFMTYNDYVHYSSEHISIAILSVALLVLCKSSTQGLSSNNSLIFFLGFIIGTIPYAKFQAVPIVLAISAIFLHLLWTKSQTITHFFRSLYSFVLGTMLFSAFIVLYITIFSLYDEFWKSYIQTNLLLYARSHLVSANSKLDFSWLQKFIVFLQMIKTPRDTKVLFTFTGLLIILGIPFLIGRRRYLKPNEEKSGTFKFVYYSLVFLAASLYSVIKPGNPFTHYLLFLIIPGGFLIGVFLGELNKFLSRKESIHRRSLKMSSMAVIAVIIVTTSFLQFYQSVKRGNPYISLSRVFAENYISPVAKSMLKYASLGESVAVWGWAPELYVETGLVQATRDGACVWQIEVHPLQQYYLKRYADDLLNSNASLFVDAVAPPMFKYHERKTQGHEAFSEIARIVRENYKLVDEVQEVRIYTKR